MGQVCLQFDMTQGCTLAELWEFMAWCGHPNSDADIVYRDTNKNVIGLRVCFSAPLA